MKWITLILLLGLCTAANGQVSTGSELLSLFSSGDKLVKRALDSSVCLVRQEYNLLSTKSGAQYGRQRKPYFGYAYSIGVITTKGIKTTPGIVVPWASEPLLKQYKDTLRPQLSATKLRKPGDKIFYEVKGITPDTTASNSSAATYSVADNLKAWRGIKIALSAKDSTGWIVILSVKKGAMLNDTVAITTSAIKAEVGRKDNPGMGMLYIKNIPPKENVIGGVYYTCTVTNGKIEFNAAGLLLQQKSGAPWYVSFLTDQRKKPLPVSAPSMPGKAAQPEDIHLTTVNQDAQAGKASPGKDNTANQNVQPPDDKNAGKEKKKSQ